MPDGGHTDHAADETALRWRDGGPPGVRQQIAAVWRERRQLPLLMQLAVTQIHARTFLGATWLAIRPLVTITVAILVVRDVLGVSTAPVPFAAFAAASMVLWMAFQRGLIHTTRSLVRARRLLKRFPVPRLAVIVSGLAPAGIETGVTALAAILILSHAAATGHPVPLGWHTLLLLPCLALVVVLVLSLALGAAILTILVPDTWHVLRYGIGVVLVASPVYYPLAAVPEDYQALMLANPLTPILETARWALFQTGTAPWGALALATLTIGVLALTALALFARWEEFAVDRL
jgi:lipopolysaccharide transport system permease protein